MKKTLLILLAAAVLLPALVTAQEEPQARLLALEAARDYLEKSRYPEHSKVLAPEAVDPLRDERASNPVTVRNKNLPAASLAVWSEDISYRLGQTMAFYARPAGFTAASITGTLSRDDGRFGQRLVFVDDGTGVDLQAGDGVYSAGFMASPKMNPELAHLYQVKVNAMLESGEQLNAITGFVLSNPWADLTGAYRDRIEGGNLVIEAQVKVHRAGRFHLSGVLHELDGGPIGTSQVALELEPGTHWMPLSFYGLMFHDRQVSGAVKLGSLSLSTTGGMPNALGKLVTDAHVVNVLEKASLRSVPYGNAADLDAARRLERDAARALAER